MVSPNDFTRYLSGMSFPDGLSTREQTIDFLQELPFEDRLNGVVHTSYNESYGLPVAYLIHDLPEHHDLEAIDVVSLIKYVISSVESKKKALDRKDEKAAISISSRLLRAYDGHEYGYIVSELIANRNNKSTLSRMLSSKNEFTREVINLLNKESPQYFQPKIRNSPFYSAFHAHHPYRELFSAWISKISNAQVENYLWSLVVNYNTSNSPVGTQLEKDLEVINKKIGVNRSISVFSDYLLDVSDIRPDLLASAIILFDDDVFSRFAFECLTKRELAKLSCYLVNDLEKNSCSVFRVFAMENSTDILFNAKPSQIPAVMSLMRKHLDDYREGIHNFMEKICDLSVDDINPAQCIERYLTLSETGRYFYHSDSLTINVLEVLKHSDIETIVSIAPKLSPKAVTELRSMRDPQDGAALAKAYPSSRHQMISHDLGL